MLISVATALFAQRSEKLPPSPAAYGVKIEKVWLPMPDGVRLAASLFMPTGGKRGEKFPTLLEYLPYRKDDGTIERDYPLHTYFAHRGYVTARVDIRGTGASEGETPEREYSQREQEDGEHVIAWLAQQPWSNGNVGMFGISWGGFNSIQMAMRRPPALKTIIAVCATEDLYNEDVHYIDGMIHVDEFEVAMDLDQSLSRSPDFPVDEKTLTARFDEEPWSLRYMRHQRQSDFWHEPVRGLSAIQIPVFMIGGMLDGYRDSIPRMLEQMKVPMKAIIGPWNHTWPDDAQSGPTIEWRREAVRWWDYWLKARDTGIMQEPKLAVYMQNWHPPDLTLKMISGEWRNEDRWPPPEANAQTLYLGSDHGLESSIPKSSVDLLSYLPSSGVEAGFWWGDLTADQRPADAFSLVYDSPPLADDTAILGRPEAKLQVSASAPLADWFARLCDVAPDGTVTLVTGSGINGSQRDSQTNPTDLEPDHVYGLNIKLHFTSWVFPKGHRIRLAVSNSWWPTIWSTPYKMTTSLYLGGSEPSRLVLPVVPLKASSPPNFQPPEPSEHLADIHSEGYPWPGEYHVTRDEVRQATHVVWRGSDGTQYPWGKRTHHEQLTYDVEDAHPETNVVVGDSDTTFELKDRTLLYRGHLEMRSDQQNFYYSYRRELSQNGAVIRAKSWRETIPRDHQ
ncbi:MAG TPA: CocE/NonD family hydrolase [Candidatus Sulfotelmatobacter sp.]|nr:CocE/NonD family hydrolase [Candidatus Sulfotelmatobacter sp.]